MPAALTLFQLNDAHGYLNLHQEAFFGPTGLEYRGGGGYARIATLLRKLREQHPLAATPRPGFSIRARA